MTQIIDDIAQVSDDVDVNHGYYIKRSRICPLCIRADHMEINMLRARDKQTLTYISRNKGIAMDTLNRHFKNHFLIAPRDKKILDLMENSSDEANSIIEKIMEGEIDLFASSSAVLESKAQRLHIIKEQLKHLSDNMEIDALEDVEKQEFLLLNREAGAIEDSIVRIYQIIDKKLFPSSREELSKAILTYKLNVLKKMIDSIVLVFLEFDKKPEFSSLVAQLRYALAQKVNLLEADILKSGGILQITDEKSGKDEPNNNNPIPE